MTLEPDWNDPLTREYEEACDHAAAIIRLARTTPDQENRVELYKELKKLDARRREIRDAWDSITD